MTYINALGRVSVLDHLCGFSFAFDPAGNPVPQVLETQLGTFSTANGIPPTSGVNLVYNDAANGGGMGKRDILASSPSTGAFDLALDGAICQRNLTVGRHIVDGGALDANEAAYARRIGEGITEVRLTARLRGKPALIVHGRADALVPVNHASRAYYGANQPPRVVVTASSRTSKSRTRSTSTRSWGSPDMPSGSCRCMSISSAR